MWPSQPAKSWSKVNAKTDGRFSSSSPRNIPVLNWNSLVKISLISRFCPGKVHDLHFNPSSNKNTLEISRNTKPFSLPRMTIARQHYSGTSPAQCSPRWPDIRWDVVDLDFALRSVSPEKRKCNGIDLMASPLSNWKKSLKKLNFENLSHLKTENLKVRWPRKCPRLYSISDWHRIRR